MRPLKAETETIELFHSREHTLYVRMASELGYGLLDQGDTPAFGGVYEAAQYAVGSTLFCLEKVMGEEVEHAFNPVGGLHHARRDSSAGFCVFNDVGVAVEVLRRQYGLRRILYVDIDVHHGDGVYYSYRSDPDVRIFDVHEDGRYLYPGTGGVEEVGVAAGEGTKVNIPLPPGAGDGQVEALLPRLRGFAQEARPEFIIFQCGADGLAGDPLAGLQYTPRTHGAVAEALHRASHELCSGRLLALGGGGYLPENCASAWTEVVRTLAIGPR